MKIIKAIPNWIYAPVLIILVIVDAIGIGALHLHICLEITDIRLLYGPEDRRQ